MASSRAKTGAKAPSGGALEARLRALYAAAPSDFTAARDALARELAAEGSADARRVKRLRRPTLPVWLVNTLARERPKELGALLAAGDRLRQAQVRALRGDTADLRSANSDLSDSVADLLRAAADISAAKLGRDPAASLLGEVERGLRAATTADAPVRAALESGVLEQLPEPGGLELLAGLSTVSPARAASGDDAAEKPRTPRPDAPATPDSRPKPNARAKAGARALERARKAEERLARAQAARRERERRRSAAEAERRERAERRADSRVREAERALEEAQRRLAVARNEADRARASARSARQKAEPAHRS